jgi:hypothetical protein
MSHRFDWSQTDTVKLIAAYLREIERFCANVIETIAPCAFGEV